MNFTKVALFVLVLCSSQFVFAQATVMNPGEAVGQLVYLTSQDVISESPKFKSLNPLSIPVFEELPMDLSVVAGSITLKQQNLLSHVQLKSRARKTPNLDISKLAGGFNNELLKPFADAAWIRMLLTADGKITLEPSTEQAATAFYEQKKVVPVQLQSDVQTSTLFTTDQLGSADYIKVGSKAANYAEITKLLNTSSRTVVRPGFAIPFFYYQEFIQANPTIETAIKQINNDPLMRKISRVTYRETKLNALRALMMSPTNVVSQKLVNDLINIFEKVRTKENLPSKIKLRSSTNSEDLPNFNGAGLYSSESYKPASKGKERTLAEKQESLKLALRTVWSSVWNLRAYDERNFFGIPHLDVKMGIQVNPSFGDEQVDGVVATKNIAGRPDLQGPGVYIEAQRGDTFSVANPDPGIKPEKILVLIDRSALLEMSRYQVHILQKSNIADDTKTILSNENPKPIMSDEEIKDLVFQSLKAEAHLKTVLDPKNDNFTLDLEFKVDSENTGARQVYIKQARPYID
ncbi:MAG: PEP/pyruvate-binding domain-containing protein [Bdellovibrionales bacterium]